MNLNKLFHLDLWLFYEAYKFEFEKKAYL